SWGMSEGIASGTAEMFGEKLLLFDAAVYPGFSGGPVVVLAPDGRPRVVGVNHAILFTGAALFSPLGPISSAVSLSELREATLGHGGAGHGGLREGAAGAPVGRRLRHRPPERVARRHGPAGGRHLRQRALDRGGGGRPRAHPGRRDALRAAQGLARRDVRGAR